MARSIGLPLREAKEVLQARRFREAVDADWEKARQYGITGVPTFVSGGRGVIGAQPYQALEQLVSAAGAHRRVEGVHHERNN